MEYFAHSQKEFVYKYVVMLSDSDQFKHMSFANYLKLMFLATDALFVSCLTGNFLSQNRFKLIDSRMQFKRQTIAGDKILIKINSSEVIVPSFSLLYTFVIEGSGDLINLGRQTYKVVNGEGCPQEIISETIAAVLDPIQVDEKHLLYKY